MPTSATHLLLWVTAALASFCVKAPAQTLPSSSSCTSLLSPLSNWLSNKDPLSNLTLRFADNLTLFKQTTFTLPANISISASFSFTSNYSTEDPPTEGIDVAPNLALILARSMPHSSSPNSVQIMEVSFEYRNHPAMGCHLNSFPACKNLPGIFADLDDEASLTDELSFTYIADLAELSGQVVRNIDGMEFQQTFNFSTNSDDGSFPSHASNFTPSTEERTTFFVGYITISGKPSINVTCTTPTILLVSSTLAKNTTSTCTHIRVLPWVILGIFTMGISIGFIIFVLLIKKRRGRWRGRGLRPLNSSHPLGQESPPLARRAPFFHRDLESSGMPMMSAPYLPPVHSNAFQISGTASWLKQPNPR